MKAQPSYRRLRGGWLLAALFNPIRRRVQILIDRRFYRRKYDAAKTLETYARGLREETDLEQLSGTQISVVEKTFQPEQRER